MSARQISGRAKAALTIAGSDSGGGAGIQADLKSFSANGVYGASVITALTAQNTIGVDAVHAVPADFVARQIDSVFSDIAIDAVKIGMLASAEIVEIVASRLAGWGAGPIVLDPVMVATSGDRLIDAGAVSAITNRLMPLAALITPNLQEAAVLLDGPIAVTEAQVIAQGRAICALGARAVLIKGGHASGAESVDMLVEGEAVRRYTSPRLQTRNTHGTGCTLSAAIAAGLAKGLPLEEAIETAKLYVTKAIAAADRLGVGRGHGPTHHFADWW